ncbi:MAG: acyl-ACP--UDP-N-acetylglucosamine O-acyltransferase [Candidatus Omnitrophota bacterium]|nr:acyl-ACP--UDP-N-acetylglucosamine O-acyltransferase [Candidatus Omnitrophota bacterium]
MEGLNIHKTAVVNPDAKLSPGVTVGAYSIVGSDVTIGDNVKIGDHCVIDGQTTVGKNSQVFTGAIIGSAPQDKKYSGQDNVYLTIGENNIIREYVTINTGTVEGGGKTVIGKNNLLMAYSHVAHDCVIGNNCVMANVGTLAGHVTLEDNAIVGGLTAVHQFVRLGRLSIVGGCSKVVQDIPPFSMCDGHPAKVYNLNLVGLKRANVSLKTVNVLKKAFKILFFSGLSKTHAIAQLEKDLEPCPEVEHLIFFAKMTKRGLCS